MSLNKVILIGHTGKDPEVRTFDNGNRLATLSVATTDRGYTLANGTVVPDRTEWHNIVARGNTVDFVEKWVKKGSLLYIEGKIRTRNYEDQAGNKRYATEILADKIEFFSMGGKKEEKEQSKESPVVPPASNDLPF